MQEDSGVHDGGVRGTQLDAAQMQWVKSQWDYIGSHAQLALADEHLSDAEVLEAIDLAQECVLTNTDGQIEIYINSSPGGYSFGPEQKSAESWGGSEEELSYIMEEIIPGCVDTYASFLIQLRDRMIYNPGSLEIPDQIRACIRFLDEEEYIYGMTDEEIILEARNVDSAKYSTASRDIKNCFINPAEVVGWQGELGVIE